MDEVKSIVLYEMLGSKALHNSAIMGSVWRILIKKDFIINNNLNFRKDTIVGEGLLFCISSLRKCKSLCIVNKHFYHYRFTPTSSMVRYRPNQWEIGYSANSKFASALNWLDISDLDEIIAFDLIRTSIGSC